MGLRIEELERPTTAHDLLRAKLNLLMTLVIGCLQLPIHQLQVDLVQLNLMVKSTRIVVRLVVVVTLIFISIDVLASKLTRMFICFSIFLSKI